MRNKDGGTGEVTNFEQQTQVNDQYIKAIEAKLKILNQLWLQDGLSEIQGT